MPTVNGYMAPPVDTTCMIVELASDGKHRVRRLDGEPFPDTLRSVTLDLSKKPQRPGGLTIGTFDQATGRPQNGTQIQITWYARYPKPGGGYLYEEDWKYVEDRPSIASN